jgi:GH15 family glucan-1,4-alpha-glucosidase
MSRLPIGDYALLSDCHTGALVSRGGSVDWLCWPRFDSPAVFGRILDDGAGHWSLGPAADAEVERSYRAPSLTVETRFRTGEGELVLEDCLAVGDNEGGHDLGEGAPHALLRHLSCPEGRVRVRMEFAPRPEYGIVHPLLRDADGGILARGGASVLRLSSPVAIRCRGGTATAEFELSGGESVAFALRHATTAEPVPEPWTREEIDRWRRRTAVAWSRWAELHQAYEGPWQELVEHSGRVLQGLTYQPTGAMVAAPTTSLPEAVGGERNWDYRYTWIRDASFTLDALWVAACPDEAHRFFDFLANTALTQMGRGGEIQIMFGIGGEHDLSERELPHLAGWRDSRPVRVGNGAWDQRQLDVYGELMGAAHRLRDHLEAGEVSREFLRRIVDTAAERWRERDRGIWEVRGEPRHFVHSKVMCWVALDRGLRMADLLEAEHRVDEWEPARDEIRRVVLEEGWSEEAGAFTQSFGSEELDASNLMLPLVGFLPPDDPRVVATLEATERELTGPGGLVYRYRAPDGLAGEEGTFLLCSFWLAEAWARAGRPGRAREIFRRAVSHRNDVGLLSEEVDPGNGMLLGNFPQAFSHIGLVNAAWAIARAEGDGDGQDGPAGDPDAACGETS